MLITLDPSLEVVPRREPYKKTFEEARQNWLNSLTGKEWETRPVTVDGRTYQERRLKTKDRVRERTGTANDHQHKSFFEYVARCYALHRGVVIGPETLWYVVLSELATHIKAHADHYRDLFTRTPGKESLLVPGTVENISIEDFLPLLREKCPVSPDVFIPEFSTSTPISRQATTAAFMDAVSPYYNYMMYLCGIPKVRITGTVTDWDTFLLYLSSLTAYLDKARPYLDIVAAHIAKIRNTLEDGEADLDWWKDMFHNQTCGSGSQKLWNGWLRDFVLDQRPLQTMATLDNFPTGISVVEVVQLETRRAYKFMYGVFYSVADEQDFLVPYFGEVVERAGTKETKTSEEAPRPQPAL